MFKIALKPYYGDVFLQNEAFKIDNGSNIYYGLNKKLKSKKIKIDTIDYYINNGKSPDLYLFTDMPYPWEFQYWKIILQNRNKSVLVCHESPLVNPFNHLSFLFRFFRRVYTWNELLVDGSKILKLNIPQLSHGLKTKRVDFTEKDFLVLINSNKSAPMPFKLISPFKTDIYEERLKAIEYFDENLPGGCFELYGKGWGEPRAFSVRDRLFGTKKLESYKGILWEKKLKKISEFKFVLAFENCSAEGYITEKIFDCFKAGCVPIYYGAPNITEHVSKDCFVDFRDFSSYAELREFLLDMSEDDYNEYLSSAQKFLTDPKTVEKWFEESYVRILTDIRDFLV